MNHEPSSDPAQLPAEWTCSKHGKLPLSEFYHAKCPTAALGWRFICRACAKDKRKKQHAASDPKQNAERQRKWRSNNASREKELQSAKYERHGHKYRRQMKTKREERRALVLKHYGGDPPKCAICSSDVYDTLCIDHTEGGGNKHRAELKRKTDSFYRWLIKQGYPDGFRVLCHNCNNTLSSYGRTTIEVDGEKLVVDGNGVRMTDQSEIHGEPGYKRIRKACICHYGGQRPACACCGDDNYEKLVIDHAMGGGCEHRRVEKIHGRFIYQWLIDQGFPEGYRVLCFNCNYTMSLRGVCAHE